MNPLFRAALMGLGLFAGNQPALHTFCGDNDLVGVNSYAGTLGPDAAFVRAHKFAVGALETALAAGSTKYCTGTLVSPELLLTASHCVTYQTVGQGVAFHYERGVDGASLYDEVHYRIAAVVEQGDAAHDYALVRLSGAPGLRFGWETLHLADPPRYSLVTLIQHPLGEPKQIEAGHVRAFVGNLMEYGDLDTESGSSGGALFDTAGLIVGVHSDGGCNASGGANVGLRLSSVSSSAALTALAAQNPVFADGQSFRLLVPGTLARLTGDPDSGRVWLAAPEDGDPWHADIWTVRDQGDATFSLGNGSAVLSARSETGEIYLKPVTACPALRDPDTLWRAMAYGDGVVLRAVSGPGNEPHWLGVGPGPLDLRLVDTGQDWLVESR